jgi:hypothetical protein
MERKAPLGVSKKVSYTTGGSLSHPPCSQGNITVLKGLFISILLLLVLSGMANIPRPDTCTCTGLSFACINVNSLNMSQANKPAQLRKLYGVLKLKTDIIFISATRISNRNLVSSENDLISIFRNNQYGSYSTFFNSTSNKRGVGILISNKIFYSVSERVADPGENYLLLKLLIQGKQLVVGSIYGPNNTDYAFFENLDRDLSAFGNVPIIIGGDWNATYSNLPVDVNPDCINMASLPNRTHSDLINNMCVTLSISDPFRALNPVLSKFSYCPRAVGATNKSRIDFF